MKANSNQAVLTTLAKLGAGMDVVSEGELRRARAAGVPGERIIFSGVGKTLAEMNLGLDEKILCFNVESEPELEALSRVGVEPRRRRADRHPGQSRRRCAHPRQDRDRQVGEQVRRADLARPRRLRLRPHPAGPAAIHGVDMHIGSQITDLQPFDDAFALLAEFVQALRADGHAIEHVDLGGGLGIAYRNDNNPPPSPEQYAKVVAQAHGGARLPGDPGAGPRDCRQCRRAGRFGHLSQEGREQAFRHRRCGDERSRPADALRRAPRDPAGERAARRGAHRTRSDVVGPVCESGDYLALDRDLPELAAGDLIAVMSAGAYGAVQAGTYNTRLLVPEVLVKGADYAVVRPRRTYEELIGLDTLPPWLK